MSDDVTVIDISDTLTLIEITLDNEEINVIPLGPAGIVPPVAVFNTVSILSQQVLSQGPDLVIDRSLGEYVRLILQDDITSFVVHNWPPPPYLGRVHLDIYNQGTFVIQHWPANSTTPYGVAPQLTAFGNDFIILTTIDGGASVKISVVSPDYQLLQYGEF
jgi:hypothetical protein